jgi:hypothetical protein
MIKFDAGSNPDAIQYAVVRNPALSKIKGTDCYNARITAPAMSLRQIAETLVNEGSKYSPAEVNAILEHAADVIARAVKAGRAVNFGALARFRPSIRGSFDGPEDEYTPGKQKIVVTASVGAALRNVAANAPTTKINTVAALPKIVAVYNAVTGAQDTLCRHGDLIVQGINLDWVEGDETGFFLEVEGEPFKCTPFNVSADKRTVFLHTDAEIIEDETAHLHLVTAEGGPVVGYGKTLTYEATPGE